MHIHYHFLLSFQALECFCEQFDPDFITIRTKAREVLQREDDLNEIVLVCFVYSMLLLHLPLVFLDGIEHFSQQFHVILEKTCELYRLGVFF